MVTLTGVASALRVFVTQDDGTATAVTVGPWSTGAWDGSTLELSAPLVEHFNHLRA